MNELIWFDFKYLEVDGVDEDQSGEFSDGAGWYDLRDLVVGLIRDPAVNGCRWTTTIIPVKQSTMHVH